MSTQQLSFLEIADQKQQATNQEIVNVASVPKRSPFRYPGGKTWFVPTFRQWMRSKKKKPKLLVEPFAGGGIIGLTAAFESLADKVLMVELDEDIASVWTTIIHGEAEKLAKLILKFEMNHANVRKALEVTSKSTLTRAFQTILRNRVYHGGIMAPGSGLMKNGENGKGLASRWYANTLAKRIMDIGHVRERIIFQQGSAFEVIAEYVDDKDSAFFIDPPYTAAGKRAGRRLYTHHQLDHHLLFDSFKKSKADFLFTYDDSDELREMATSRKYEIALIPMKNTHHAKMSELIVGKDLAWLKK